MKISSFIITMLLVSSVIISIYNFTNDLRTNQEWNVQINSSYKNTYNKINELQNITNETLENVREVARKEDKGFFTGVWDAFIITKDVTVGAGKTTITGLTIGTTLIGDFINDMNIGSENSHIVAIIVTILTILVIGALIVALVRGVW